MRRWLLMGALLAVPALAMAQQPKQSRAHMEACVRWIATAGQYLTLNSCDTAISIQFMALADGRTVERDVLPGNQFESGPMDPTKPTEMIFTVCPTGYRPSVRFARENAETISESLYNCLPLGKPGS
jgi:hypothetical protein